MRSEFSSKYPQLARRIVELARREGSKWQLLESEPKSGKAVVLCSGNTVRGLAEGKKGCLTDWWSWVHSACADLT